MDGNQQLELVNTDRSCWSRSHSRLSSALQYEESRKSTSRPSSTASAKINNASQAHRLDRTPEMETARNSPESTVNAANRGWVSPSPFAYKPLPPIKTSQRDEELKETNRSEEMVGSPDIGAESSTEPWKEKENEFQVHRNVVNRGGISPSLFAYRPLPPIKTLQKDGELKDTDNSKRVFDSLDIKAETSENTTTRTEKENEFQIHREEEREKTVKEGTKQELRVILPNEIQLLDEKHGMENTESRGVTESPINDKVDLPCSRKSKQPISAQKIQKPSSQPKCHIVVRETKASKLRKTLQMQNGQAGKTLKRLPPVKVPVKCTTQTSMVKTQRRMSRSPSYHSRSPSESPPPTPRDPGPPRPHFVPRLDLSFLLSPDDYPKGDPIPPPEFVVRETKASRLRRLKKLEVEKDAKRQEGSEKLKDMTFHQPREKFLRKKSPIPIFKPAPPKPYKKPESVIVKETRASKLRKLDKGRWKLTSTQGKQDIRWIRTTSQQRIDMEHSHQPKSTKANDERSSKSHQLQDKEKTRNEVV